MKKIIANTQAVVKKDGSISDKIARVSVNVDGKWCSFVTGLENVSVRKNGAYAIVSLSDTYRYNLEVQGTYNKETNECKVIEMTGKDLYETLKAARNEYTKSQLPLPAFAQE